MRVIQVSLPHFYQIDSQDQTAMLSQFTSLFASPIQHGRFLTFVMPASLEQLERERRHLAMQVQDEWLRRGMMEEVYIIGEWARRGEMRHTRHFLLDFNDALTTRDLAHWRVLTEEGYPQLPIVGDYSESHDHMTPVIQKADGSWQADNSHYRYSLLTPTLETLCHKLHLVAEQTTAPLGTAPVGASLSAMWRATARKYAFDTFGGGGAAAQQTVRQGLATDPHALA